jgi:hypothetical protein
VLTSTSRARADEVLSRLELVWGRPGGMAWHGDRLVLMLDFAGSVSQLR